MTKIITIFQLMAQFPQSLQIQIQSLFTEGYFHTIRQYEWFLLEIQSIIYDPTLILSCDPTICTPTNIQLLEEGQNPSKSVNLRVIRSVLRENVCFILGYQINHGDRLYAYASVTLQLGSTPFGDGSQIPEICKKVKFNETITLCSPYNVTKAQGFNYFIVKENSVKVQNPQSITEVISNPSSIKEKAKKYFNNSNYYQALLCYELALCFTSDYNRNKRAILYSNSAACLLNLRLYEIGLVYSELSILLDKTYVKGYDRKINCLLELNQYDQIPSLINSLSNFASQKQVKMERLKYTQFIASEEGIFSWLSILNNNSILLANYTSESVYLKSNFKTKCFVAAKEIQQYELIAVRRPILYIHRQDISTDFKQVEKYCIFQQSFYRELKKFPCRCPTHQQDKTLLDYTQIKKPHYEILCKLKENIILERILESLKKQIGRGIWKDQYCFKQNCLPNCSFMHLKNCMFVSAMKRIREGEQLSIDFYSDVWFGQRNKMLKEIYPQGCKCFKCNENMDQCMLIELLMIKNESQDILSFKKAYFWQQISDYSLSGARKKISKEKLLSSISDYLDAVEKDFSWEDVANIFKLYRDFVISSSHSNRIKSLILKSLQKLLRLPDSQQIFKLIK